MQSTEPVIYASYTCIHTYIHTIYIYIYIYQISHTITHVTAAVFGVGKQLNTGQLTMER